ncbi:MAG: hypothetical protein HUN05_13975 [Desulfobacter sp.]|nr:MAG: hypothetical protein HUN05_13975 [Desulfobacter sp.]
MQQNPIYHTNVMMSIGDKYAVVCLECIPNKEERAQVRTFLEKEFEIIEISMDQMENYFCGNILQVNLAGGRALIVMSQKAHDEFNADQIKRLQAHGRILPMDLTVIETIGGGSARCMMAEIFSEKK